MPMESDGSEIRRRRQRLGIKRGEFARQLDIVPAWLSQIEGSGRQPSPELLHRIAAALNCDVDDLLVKQGVA